MSNPKMTAAEQARMEADLQKMQALKKLTDPNSMIAGALSFPPNLVYGDANSPPLPTESYPASVQMHLQSMLTGAYEGRNQPPDSGPYETPEEEMAQVKNSPEADRQNLPVWRRKKPYLSAAPLTKTQVQDGIEYQPGDYLVIQLDGKVVFMTRDQFEVSYNPHADPEEVVAIVNRWRRIARARKARAKAILDAAIVEDGGGI